MTGTASRLRALGASFLIATWAMGAAVLPVMHPCPVNEAVVIAPIADTEASHAGHGVPEAPPHDHGAQQCQCIGSCHATPAVDAPRAPILMAAAPDLPTAPAWPRADSTTGESRIVDFLPPSTAPPTA